RPERKARQTATAQAGVPKPASTTARLHRAWTCKTLGAFPKPPNGEVEGPDADAQSEPRVHTVLRHPRRHYRLSRPPPTIVRGAGVPVERRHLNSLAQPHRATARSSEVKRRVRHNEATEAECSR